MNLRVNLETIQKEHNIDQIIHESIIRYGDKYEKQNPLITVLNGVNETNYLNYGGISAVLGKQKSRKTFYLSCVMAAAVGNDIIDDRLRGYTFGKKHIWFDTEQSKYYASKIPYRVVRKIGMDKHPDNFDMLSIKKYTTNDRVRIIEHYIDNTKNLGLVVIDGVRDLVHDFNNLSECTELINKLMNWVDTTNCHICLVLHINPLKKGDEEKPRGHLGTEIQNKVESSILIEKSKIDKNISIITPRDFRDKDINKFGLAINEKGIPYLIGIDDEIDETF